MMRIAVVVCALWCSATAAKDVVGAAADTAADRGHRAMRDHSGLVGDNKELFTKLGLERLHIPAGHHRKRLAEESRHQSDASDSKMYVIKLPPHPHYYTGENPNAIQAAPAARKLPVGFKSNGKPGRVYHWNVPLLRQIADKQARLEDLGEKKSRLDKRHHSSKNAVTFYVPGKPKKSFHKYFPGNGKPKSIYVMHKSKPAFYHRLMP